VLPKLLQTTVVMMPDINVGLAQFFGDFVEVAALIKM
jgi:hypothetical protein